MARRGRGTTSARREQLQQREKAPVAGTLRPLVPFYVPDGADGAGKVNTDLRFYESRERHDTSRPLFEPAPGAAGAGAPIPVWVRNWDARQGTFGREAVHYVSSAESDLQAVQCHSSRAATQSVSPEHMTLKRGSDSTSDLLTPDMILQNGGKMNNFAGNIQYAGAEEFAGSAHKPDLRPRARTSDPALTQMEKTTATRSSASATQPVTAGQHEAAHRRVTGPSRGPNTSPQHARRNSRHGTLTSRSSQGKRGIPADEHARYAGSSYSSATPAPQAVPVPQFAARYLANQAVFSQESPGWAPNQLSYPNRVAEQKLPGADMRLPMPFGAQHPITEMNHNGQPLMPLSAEASNMIHMRAPDPTMPLQMAGAMPREPHVGTWAPIVSAVELYRHLETSVRNRSSTPMTMFGGRSPTNAPTEPQSAPPWLYPGLPPAESRAPAPPVRSQTDTDPVSEQLRRVLNLPPS